jgi:uncharacterized protein YkwD
MLRQHIRTWLPAGVVGLVAVTVPAPVAADVCLPVLPTVPVVTQSCASAAQSQPGSTFQSTQADQTESRPTAKTFSVASTPELARALLTEVNRTRRAHGLRALRFSAPLTDAGTAHAQALAAAGQFTHAWPTTGRLFGSWIRSFYSARGYRTWSVGENLLWGSPGFTPASAVRQWLDSPSHRRVLLSPRWRELGIGVVSAVAAPGTYGGRDVQIAAAEFGMRRS